MKMAREHTVCRGSELLVTLYPAPTAVAFGLKLPSKTFMMWSEYHCWIPNFFASLSAISFSMFERSAMPELTAVSTAAVALAHSLPNRPPRGPHDGEEGSFPALVGVAMRFWPSLEVLSMIM